MYYLARANYLDGDDSRPRERRTTRVTDNQRELYRQTQTFQFTDVNFLTANATLSRLDMFTPGKIYSSKITIRRENRSPFIGLITIGGSVPTDLALGSVLASAFTILTKAEPAVAVALALPISLLAVFVY